MNKITTPPTEVEIRDLYEPMMPIGEFEDQNAVLDALFRRHNEAETEDDRLLALQEIDVHLKNIYANAVNGLPPITVEKRIPKIKDWLAAINTDLEDQTPREILLSGDRGAILKLSKHVARRAENLLREPPITGGSGLVF